MREVSTTVQNPDDEPEFFVGEVNANPTAEDSDFEWTTLLETNGTLTKFKLDTGSQVNLLPISAYQCLRTRPKLHATTVTLTAYNGTSIPVAGKCLINLTNNGKNIPTLFIIANMNSVPILGLAMCKKLNLISRVMTVECKYNKYSSLINEYSDCFGEIDELSKLHHLTVDPNFSPVIQAPRKIPFVLRDKPGP